MKTGENATEGIAEGAVLFTKLPPELLVRILCREGLEITDILLFGATSKDLHACINGSAELWRTLYVRDFTKLHPEEKNMDAALIKKRYRQKHVRKARKGKPVKWSRDTIVEAGELMGDFVSHARKRFWLRRILGNLCLIFALSRIAVGDYGVIPFIGLPLGMHLMFNWLFDSLMSFGDVRG